MNVWTKVNDSFLLFHLYKSSLGSGSAFVFKTLDSYLHETDGDPKSWSWILVAVPYSDVFWKRGRHTWYRYGTVTFYSLKLNCTSLHLQRWVRYVSLFFLTYFKNKLLIPIFFWDSFTETRSFFTVLGSVPDLDPDPPGSEIIWPQESGSGSFPFSHKT